MKNFNAIARGIGYKHLVKGIFDLDVIRIDVDNAIPFVIGATLGEIVHRPNSKDQPTAGRRMPYAMIDTRKFIAPTLQLNKIIDVYDSMPGEYHTFKKLNPVWVSNGTFFEPVTGYYYDKNGKKIYYTEYDAPTTVNGPVIATVRAPKRDRFADATRLAKRNVERIVKNRWYVRQDNPYSIPVLKQGPIVANSLPESVRSLVGGAGPLIIGGKVASVNNRENLYNFQQNAYYDPGPIIAQNSASSNRRIFYLIMSRKTRNRSDDGWTDIANYISYKMISDLGQGANDKISEAIVFDGGGSKSLWIPNFVSPRSINNRPVPNFLWVWGQPLTKK